MASIDLIVLIRERWKDTIVQYKKKERERDCGVLISKWNFYIKSIISRTRIIEEEGIKIV